MSQTAKRERAMVSTRPCHFSEREAPLSRERRERCGEGHWEASLACLGAAGKKRRPTCCATVQTPLAARASLGSLAYLS